MQWKEIRLWSHKYWYLMLSIVMIECFLYSLPMENYKPDYLLSALIQSLATVFALAFTITLIIAQMSDDHELSLRILLDRKTICFMLLFVFSIILATLGLLHSHYTMICSRGAVMLSGACFFFLVPYFLSVSYKINRTHELEILEKWIKARMDKLPDGKFMDELSKETLEPMMEDLRKIQTLGSIAYKKGDGTAFKKSLDVLLSLTSNAKFNDVMEAIIERFVLLGRECEEDDKKFSVLASKILDYTFTGDFPNELTSRLIEVLNDMGIETRNLKVCSMSIQVLEEIRIKTKEQKDIIDDLLKMADEGTRELKLHFQALKKPKGKT